MAKKVYEEANISAIADKIREKIGSDATYKTSEMPNGIELVYESARNNIFEKIQAFGEAQNYYYAFANDRFDDTNYLPIYPIKCSNGTTTGRYMFYNSPNITDTKVEIVANSNNIDYAFYGCTGLKTIQLLTVTETTSMNNTFAGCSSLTDITFGGTIGQNFSFKDSPLLSDYSIRSITEHLKDLKDAESKTWTVHPDVYQNMQNDINLMILLSKNWVLVSG